MAEEATPTPVTTPVVTPSPAPETVVLSKEEHAQLEKDAARSRSNQSKADRYDRIVSGNGQGRFSRPVPPAQPTPEEQAAQATEQDRIAERGLSALAADPAFREQLDADPTLRQMLISNPLGVLPILAPDALDAEDAISLVREKLSERKPVKPAPVAPAPEAKKPETPVAPPVGAINAPSLEDANPEYAAAKKLPSTEQAIAAMVGVKARATAKK